MNRIALLLLLLPGLAFASDPDKPHGHQGHFAAITAEPAAIAVTDAEWVELRKGEVVQRQKRGEDAGWGAAVQLVNAPESVVWDTILAYDRYVDWVKNVKSATIYKTVGNDLYLDMQSGIAGFTFGIYTINDVHRDDGWMAWTLDYDRKSDDYDLVGYWRTEQIQADPPITRLDYVTNIKIRGVPNFIINHMTKSSLTDGTAWVKKQSELAAK